MKTALYLLTAFLFLAMSAISCSEEPKALVPTDTPSTETPTTPTTPEVTEPGVTAGTFVFLKVGTRWESAGDGDEFQNWKTCAVTPNSPSSDITCDVSIPEAQLYRSKVEFKVGSLNPDYCPILTFRPYYYKRSDSSPQTTNTGPPDGSGNPTPVTTGGYVPYGSDSGATVLSCAPGTTVKECFGGAAPVMIDDFPKNSGKYFLTNVQSVRSFVLDASNQARYYGNNLVNYMVINDLSAVNRAIPLTNDPRERVADKYYDYEIECTSYWGERLFGITLTISDENWDASGGFDHYLDWN
ncbi:hypothetical protein ACNQKP_00650 [Bdellovibrio bacteriovorus]|uniref:hypothetical protein n=1 Tax=Bdellovibrio bacteriovorus TaxID=959 RepID=UPI003AA810DC